VGIEAYLGAKKRKWTIRTSKLGSAGATGLELAVLALIDVPMRPAMAHRTDPLDERGLGLEQVEGVMAVARDRHDERWPSKQVLHARERR
jgi:hypothetical protein